MNTPSLVALPISGGLPDGVIRKVINILPSNPHVPIFRISRNPGGTDANERGVVPPHQGDHRIMWWIDQLDPGRYETFGILNRPECDKRLETISFLALKETLEFYHMAPPDNLQCDDLNWEPIVVIKELEAVIHGTNWDEGRLLHKFTEIFVEKINHMEAPLLNGRHPFYYETLPAGVPAQIRDETDPDPNNHIVRETYTTEAYVVWYIPPLHPTRKAVRATSTRGAGLLRAAREEVDSESD